MGEVLAPRDRRARDSPAPTSGSAAGVDSGRGWRGAVSVNLLGPWSLNSTNSSPLRPMKDLSAKTKSSSDAAIQARWRTALRVVPFASLFLAAFQLLSLSFVA